MDAGKRKKVPWGPGWWLHCLEHRPVPKGGGCECRRGAYLGCRFDPRSGPVWEGSGLVFLSHSLSSLKPKRTPSGGNLKSPVEITLLFLVREQPGPLSSVPGRGMHSSNHAIRKSTSRCPDVLRKCSPGISGTSNTVRDGRARIALLIGIADPRGVPLAVPCALPPLLLVVITWQFLKFHPNARVCT